MGARRDLLAIAILVAVASAARAAGDVHVELDAHRTVRLTGDDFDNLLQVASGDLDGTWRIAGIDGTTLDGEPEIVVAQPAGLRADLGDGADRLEVLGIATDRDLRVQCEGGDDVVVLRQVVVRGRTAWTGGRGNDRLDVDESCVFRRAVRLTGKAGDDVLIVKGSRALGPTRIRGNRGSDQVILRRMSFTDNATLRLLTGDGEDVVTFDTCKLDRRVYVGTGRSEDYVTVVDTHANGDFRAGLGRADDRLNLDDTTFGEDVRLDGDSGVDTLDLDGDVRFRGAENGKHELRIVDFERRRY